MDTPPLAPIPTTPPPAQAPKANMGLRGVIAGMVVIIAAGAGWVFWPHASTLPQPTTTPDEAAKDWETFRSVLLPLTFKYPAGLLVEENEYLTDQGVVHTGKQVHFGEGNDAFPSFYVITNDFSAVDSTPHDVIDGPLDSATSFHVVIFDEKYQNITEIEPGIFRVDGYGNIECSPFISSLLFMQPPVTLGLKYAQFYLGRVPDFLTSDMRSDDPCSPTDEAIRAKLAELHADEHIAARLNAALPIARSLAAPVATDSLQYRDEQYGLSVYLPKSWKNYSVRDDSWEAYSIGRDGGDTVIARGPKILIQHPLASGEAPRQDIPVMIFTFEEWTHVDNNDIGQTWSLGAAPVGPMMLARNEKYIFALPARYNFAFLDGWEEVEALIRGGAVQAF